MREAVQGTDGGLEHPVARLIVEARDQAKAAGVLLIGTAIQAPVRGTRIGPVRGTRIGPAQGILEVRNVALPHSSPSIMRTPAADPQRSCENNHLTRLGAPNKSQARRGKRAWARQCMPQ